MPSNASPMRPALLPLLALVGCTSTSRTLDESVDADGIFDVVGTVDRGSFAYTGDSEAVIAVGGTSTGYGGGNNQAARRENGNALTVEVDGNAVEITGTSEFNRASMDIDVSGPFAMNLDVLVHKGSADFEDAEGDHIITADRVTAYGLVGNADILARSGGLEVELWPWDDADVVLESSAGNAVIWLPYGLDYDLEVIGDPSYEMYVDNLGFESDIFEPGYFYGAAGDGSVRVTVFVDNGSTELLELR